MDAISFDPDRYDIVTPGDLRQGDRVRLPLTVTSGRAASWQIGTVGVDRVEWKADGVVFLWLSPDSIKPNRDHFIMLCGGYLAAGVMRAKPVTKEGPDEELLGEIVPATDLKPGDVVSRSTFDVSQRAEILKPSEDCEYWLTGPGIRYWARDLATNRDGWLSYGPSGVVRRLASVA
ncbi:hypothetical protein ACF1DV_26085 [Streptomyces achromogenes]|uniref:hypothetical protein n=1 Tax=Streptomyces achromogenes TaxID=67255 RepID=UPI0036F7A9B7